MFLSKIEKKNIDKNNNIYVNRKEDQNLWSKKFTNAAHCQYKTNETEEEKHIQNCWID